MKKLLIALVLLAAMAGGAILFLRGPMEQTTSAALRAFPVYSFVRIRNETLLRARHQGVDATNLLIHRPNLSGPRDRTVTTPNNDTLYSLAFLALGNPRFVSLPPLPDRYHSVAVMDARTDNIIVAGTRDSPALRGLLLCAPDDRAGRCATAGLLADDARVRVVHLPTDEAWLLVRVLVDGPDDLLEARAAQAQFGLGDGIEAPFPDRPEPPVSPALLPALPDPDTLLRHANPVIARHPHLQDAALVDSGHGGSGDAFADLPWWRQWLWRIILPRIFDRMRAEIADGPRRTGDGWSLTPPGIGTAEASDPVRAAVALAGLGALPVEEAVYWSATLDSDRADLDGAHRYRLTIPSNVPARAFWSLSLYERLPDGRLFYVQNPADRYTIGNRTPGMVREADGSMTISIAAADPGAGANWLPAPPRGPFTLIFRAYLPEPALQRGEWRLPPVARLP